MFELKKWEPFRELSLLQREMDDFFKRVFGTITPTGLLKRELPRVGWYPAIDVFMKDGKFVVHAELPGIDPKDVDISIVGNMLTLRGERKSDVEGKKEGWLFRETSYGSFERSIALPEGVESDKCSATYRNGILELTMPAKATALPRKIKVEVEGEKEAKKVA